VSIIVDTRSPAAVFFDTDVVLYLLLADDYKANAAEVLLISCIYA
jgi:hypothetical protein